MQNNFAYFRPERGELQEGIRGASVFREDIGQVLLAISLARLVPVEFESNRKAWEPMRGQSQKVVWQARDAGPIIKDNVFLSGSIITDGEGRNRRHFIGGPRKGGMVIRIDAGLWGNDAEKGKLFGLMAKLADGTPVFQPMGSYDLSKGGAENLLDADHEIEKSYHVGWSFSGKPTVAPTKKGEVKVFPRRADLWRTQEGSELITQGCYPGSLFRLIHEKSNLKVEKLTDPRWVDVFDEMAWNAEVARIARESKRGQAAAA